MGAGGQREGLGDDREVRLGPLSFRRCGTLVSLVSEGGIDLEVISTWTRVLVQWDRGAHSAPSPGGTSPLVPFHSLWFHLPPTPLSNTATDTQVHFSWGKGPELLPMFKCFSDPRKAKKPIKGQSLGPGA